MPEKRGRKRKPARERSRGAGTGAAARQDDITPPERARPSVAPNTARAALRWRYAGLVLAVVTAMVSILTIADVFTGDYNAVNLVFRVGTGTGLGLLAIAIVAMVLIPDRLRTWLFRE
jgi:hypothetical protein